MASEGINLQEGGIVGEKKNKVIFAPKSSINLDIKREI